MRFFCIFSLIVAFAGTLSNASASPQLQFRGGFETVEGSDPLCKALFDPTEYEASFYLVGPTYRTAVLHFFRNEPKGFFHRMSLVGLYGGTGDIQVTKTFATEGKNYEVVAEGIVSQEVLLVDVRVKVTEIGAPKKEICQANSNFSAFN